MAKISNDFNTAGVSRKIFDAPEVELTCGNLSTPNKTSLP